ncbi:MAG: cob(I)yrinic acid a,c-diamide adenosyltransferase [Bacteroidota bacterium]
MKIYTKKGDTGQTSLFGGERVSKQSKRIDAYGTVDELNSILGMVRASNPSESTDTLLNSLQHQLFVLGADLATPISREVRIDRISDTDVQFLEQKIDEMEEGLAPLKNFILPSGTLAGSTLHFARTVCRRAERVCVEASDTEHLSATTITYLNRLSDLLFVLARFENQQAGTEEFPWIPT